VAARRLAALLEAGARVTLVAPALCDELALQQPAAGWGWLARPFAEADAAGRFLVLVATDDPETNRRAAEAGRRAGALVNVADDPEACDFFLPAVLRRGQLQLAVTTGGRSPALAARLRRLLAEMFPPSWEEVVALLGEAREAAREQGHDESTRRELSRALAALDLPGLLAEGGVEKVRQAVEACRARFAA